MPTFHTITAALFLILGLYFTFVGDPAFGLACIAFSYASSAHARIS